MQVHAKILFTNIFGVIAIRISSPTARQFTALASVCCMVCCMLTERCSCRNKHPSSEVTRDNSE